MNTSESELRARIVELFGPVLRDLDPQTLTAKFGRIAIAKQADGLYDIAIELEKIAESSSKKLIGAAIRWAIILVLYLSVGAVPAIIAAAASLFYSFAQQQANGPEPGDVREALTKLGTMPPGFRATPGGN